MIQSKCCNSSELIEPDWDAAEEMGSLWPHTLAISVKNVVKHVM